ncbi:hypothetical protein DFJ74DRAFT_678637 [Hyaloraphidium curvatum]|nr:hypothetical protein DFJ74DRAFT_678637 [Hyaloraphidium curvatum]
MALQRPRLRAALLRPPPAGRRHRRPRARVHAARAGHVAALHRLFQHRLLQRHAGLAFAVGPARAMGLAVQDGPEIEADSARGGWDIRHVRTILLAKLTRKLQVTRCARALARSARVGCRARPHSSGCWYRLLPASSTFFGTSWWRGPWL